VINQHRDPSNPYPVIAAGCRVVTASTRREERHPCRRGSPASPHVFSVDVVTSRAYTSASPLILKLICYSLLLPEELSFFVLGLRLTVTRLIFLLLTPVLLIRIGHMLAAGRYRFALSDLFVPLAGLWMVIAPSVIDGVQESLTHNGPTALEFCIGYMAARTLLSEHGQALSFAELIARLAAVVALIGLLDPLTDHFFLQELAGALTGYPVPVINDENAMRMGLVRATGPIEHSILFGIVCAVGLLFASSLPIRMRLFVILSCSLGAIFSFSSAAVQGVLLGIVLLAYNRMLAGVRFRWIGLIVLAAVPVIMLVLFVDAPFSTVCARVLIFDPASCWIRLLTWNMAGEALAQSPWVGLGFQTPEFYGIPPSVDSLWLEAALKYGIPGSLLIALSIVGCALPTGGPRVCLTKAELKLGTILGILIFLIIFWGFTVFYWGMVWILVSLLLGMKAHLGALGRLHIGSREREDLYELSEAAA
jgi:hypothetical protein